MGWMLLWLVLAVATQIGLSLRISRHNVPLAIATALLGPPVALYVLFKYREEEDPVLTPLPVVANLAFCALFLIAAWPHLSAKNPSGTAQAAVVPDVRAEPAPVAAPPKPRPARPADPVAAFSAVLQEARIGHAVTRMSGSDALPAGVGDAALFVIAAVPASPGTPERRELAATLFKCESANACRTWALAYLQKSQGQQKKRVLQNGSLLLLMPPTVPNDEDPTPANVALAFRELQAAGTKE